MTTAAFYDGKAAGYFGVAREQNPYRKGWARLGHGDIATLEAAMQWDFGYDAGAELAIQQSDLLLTALDNLGKLVKVRP